MARRPAVVSVPARLDASRWAHARGLVLAPHPDDETLGAGALIAQAAASGRLAGVAYLTAGDASHPGRGPALAAARRAEAALALQRLTGGAVAVTWLGWPDAHPVAAGSARHRRDARRLAGLLRRGRVDALAVTGAAEPHCDHAAAFGLARAAAALCPPRVRVFEYLVWAPSLGRPGRALRTGVLAPRRRRHALGAHHSQLTPRFGVGFRLAASRFRAPAFDTLYPCEGPA